MVTKKRIRLTVEDCKLISKTLRFYEVNSKGESYDQENWREESKRLIDLSRRFHCLSEEDGFYARSTRT